MSSAPPSGVFLLRHGRTALNAVGQLRGRVDVPLDEVGLDEAARLGVLFAPVDLAAVFSSPLARSVRTAAAVASCHGLAVEVDERFTDRDWGPWAGADQAEVSSRFGSVENAPGIEPREAFEERILRAFERAASRAAVGSVIVVAHDAVNRAILSILDPAQGAGRSIPQRTGCWNHLVLGASGWSAPVVDAVPGDGRSPGQGVQAAAGHGPAPQKGTDRELHL